MLSHIKNLFVKEQKPREVVGICLALADIYSNKGEGGLIYPEDASIERFTATVEAAHFVGKGELKLIVCTAGYNWKNPTMEIPSRKRSLSEQLKRYVTEHYPAYKDVLKISPLCWGIRNEIREGIKLILQSGISKDDEVVLVIAANKEHLPRVALYVSLYIPKRWRVKYALLSDNFSVQDKALEMRKYLVERLLYPLRFIMWKAGY